MHRAWKRKSNKRKGINTIQVEMCEVYIGLCFYANVLVRKGLHLGSNKGEGGGSCEQISVKNTEAFYADGGFKRSKMITTQSRD